MITRNAVFAAKKLKGVIARGVGYDHVDVKTPTEKREYVTNTLGANAVSVAEFAFSRMICAARTILRLNSRLRASV